MIEVGCVCQNTLRKFRIRILPLIECLDHLNTADIFCDGGVHFLRNLDGPFILFPVICHDCHHERHADRDRDEREQCHPPVKDKQIDQDAHRSQYIRRHLRQKMCKRTLHTFDLIHDDLFHLSAGGVHDNSQRKLRKFGKDTFPDIFQNRKCRLVGHGECERVKNCPQDVASQCQTAPEQIIRSVLFVTDEPDNNLCRCKIRQYAA